MVSHQHASPQNSPAFLVQHAAYHSSGVVMVQLNALTTVMRWIAQNVATDGSGVGPASASTVPWSVTAPSKILGRFDFSRSIFFFIAFMINCKKFLNKYHAKSKANKKRNDIFLKFSQMKVVSKPLIPDKRPHIKEKAVGNH